MVSVRSPGDLGDEFFKTLLDNLSEGVYFVDTERRISYWNRGAELLTGYSAAEVIGRHCADNLLVHVDCQGSSLCQADTCPAAAVMADGAMRQSQVFLHHREGHRVPVVTRITPIRDGDGRIVGAVEVFTDNTAVVAASEQIERLERAAMLDPLTGVGNRRHGELGLQAKLDEMDRYGWGLGVAFVDIDGFKGFNDRHGHDVGDRVLRTVAQTLMASVRSFDLVVRWGGEEFVVALSNITREQLHRRVDGQRRLVARSGPSSPAGPLSVTVSVGATMARHDDTPESVVARADALMFESKRSGRDRVTVG